MPAIAEFDVAILGAGPAGSTIARCLALRGHRVCLLHRAPRIESLWARWETLSPGALGLMRLHHCDVWPSIARLLVPCRAATLWTRSDDHSEQEAVRHGTLVDRRLVDPLLLASAVAAGAASFAVDRSLPLPSIPGDFAAWVLFSDQSGASKIVSRFLVDAAGRSSPLRGTRFPIGPRTLALTAHVVGTCLKPRSTCVEAFTDGWLWAGRGNEAAAAVTLFVSPRTVRSWSRGERSTRFLQTLRTTSLAARAGAPRMVSNLIARDATALERRPLKDDDLLRVGDAALALDPLSGQGFQHALVSAAQVAIVIHTMVARKESSMLAGEFYRARHAEAAYQHGLACRVFYQRQNRFNGEFWRERMGENSLPSPLETPSESFHAWIHERLVLSDKVRWKDVPAIAGEFVERERALFHPSLTRPIAYLEGRIAFDMLADLSGEVTGLALLQRWADRAELPRELGLRALRFLVRHGIFLPAGRGTYCPSLVGLPLPSH